MVNYHTHYPYSAEAVISFAAYFQNISNAIAGVAILSGFEVSRASASSVTVAAGTYMNGTPATLDYAGTTLSGAAATAAGLHRYDLIYLDGADGTVKRAVGTPFAPTTLANFLENPIPQPPDLPTESSILLAVICVDDAGIRSTDNGGYSVAGVSDARLKLPFGAHLLSYLSVASQARGDLIMRGASAWGRFGPGAQYKYLMANGSAADLTWENLQVSALYHSSEARGCIPTRGTTTWGVLVPSSGGKVLTEHGAGADITWEPLPEASTFWRTVPGTPTRVSDTQFTITDTSNANLYDKAFSKGTLLKWEKSGGGFQCAMVILATYSANAVTIDIVGNALANAFSGMKYCSQNVLQDTFIVPGTMPGNTATADIGKTVYATQDLLVIAAQVRYKTAPTTTKGVWDINDDATTIFTTKPEIAAAATLGVIQVCDCVLTEATTVVAKDSALTLDYDSGHATTPGANAYVTIFYIPESWRYRS